MSSLYTSLALAEAAGVTYRQVNYWTRQGYLVPKRITGAPEPKGTGQRMIFGDEDILRAKLLGLLLDPDMAATLAVELANGNECNLRGFAFSLAERP